MNKSTNYSEGFAKDQHDADVDENLYYHLYDDAWKSEESDATSLHEFPLSYLDRNECEDTVNNAITEVFSDFMSGKRVDASPNKYGESEESHSDADFKSLPRLAYVARYPETAAGMSDSDWNPYGTESDTNISPRIPYDSSIPILSDTKMSSLNEFNPPLYSTDVNVNTPSIRMYTIPDSEARTVKSNDQEQNHFFSLKPEISSNFSSASHSSQRVDSDKPLTTNHCADLNKTLRVAAVEKSYGKPCTKIYNNDSANIMSLYTDENAKDNASNTSTEEEFLNEMKAKFADAFSVHQKQKISPAARNHDKINMKKKRSLVDYKLLHQDLQDIQDSLKSTASQDSKLNINEMENSEPKVKILESSGSECDIIPSTTTTTPDREHNKMSWDFAADLGYHQPGDLMGDISLDTYVTNSCRPSEGKKSYNSDGDETITSGCSDKVMDNIDVSQILQPENNNHTSFKDVDTMLYNFRNQREQIESRYQQLNNKGLAEKVYRILSNQNPNSQVSGLLSEITEQENEKGNKPAFKDLNFSVISSHLDESNQSLAFFDNVRKRLELSGLSSADISKLTDKSGGGNGFTALDGMAKLLSSQMAKALERTFNHSIENIVPQRTIQCYPLTVDNKPTEKKNDRADKDSTRTSSQPLERTANRLTESTEADISEDDKQKNKNIQANKDSNQNSAHTQDDSDSSATGRHRERFRPYRPAGSKEVYYTESDGASVTDSVTTMESTHFGSDDAKGPVLPPSALGSRQDAPNVAGIYGNRIPLFTQEGETLAPIQERSGLDERETESSHSNIDKTSESRSQGREQKGSSDKGSFAEKNRDNGSIQSQDNGRNNERAAMTEQAGASESLIKSTSQIRSGGESTNTRAQKEGRTSQEQLRGVGDRNSSQKNREQVHERNQRSDYISHRSRYDDYLSSEQYRRPTDIFEGSEYSHTFRSQNEIHPESLSHRQPLIYDNDKYRHDEASQQFNSAQDNIGIGEIEFTAENTTSISKPRLSQGQERSLSSRFDESEIPFSSQNPHSMNKDKYLSERHGTHNYAEDDSHQLGRSAHISPLFHNALSPDLRRAIRNRSPILSRHIERSLSQPPSEFPDHRQRSAAQRDHSSPPFSKEGDELPREIAGSQRRSPNFTSRSDPNRPWSPRLQVRADSSSSQDDMSQHRAERNAMTVGELCPTRDETEADHRPVGQRVQLLTQALAHDKDLGIHSDIGSLWEQFKANNESSESCISSSSLDAVTDLILNPSPHLANQCLKEREEQIIQRQERVEAERMKRRADKRQEQSYTHQNSSEEDFHGDYAELLAEKEMERMKRRMAKKKKGKFPDPVALKSEGNRKENIADKLFSIPEDASFEQTPKKIFQTPKQNVLKVARQPHMIDPNMEKLRDRIVRQKQKIDKQTLKEIQRIDKLKKLEMLLSAKKDGVISDCTLEMQLEDLSSTTTPGSDNSQERSDNHAGGHNTTPLSDDSTTAKDSSNEMQTRKIEKEIRMKDKKPTDKEQLDKYRLSTIQDRNFSSTKLSGSQGTNTQKSKTNSSECQLLKLVKDGFLTVEEAYRLAVERQAAQKLSPSDASHGSSSDELHSNHSNRMHKMYSPYSREDNIYSHKTRYIPKLKLAPSGYGFPDFRHSTRSDFKHNIGQNIRNMYSELDHNDSHISNFEFENDRMPSRIAAMAHSESASNNKRAISSLPLSRSGWQMSRKTYGSSSSASYQPTATNRSSNKGSNISRTSPSRHEHSPTTRAQSSSPRRTKYNVSNISSRKQANVSSKYERTNESENIPPWRTETPDRGGIAWHIPMDLHYGNQRMPKEMMRRALPLQESQQTNNTLLKKISERSVHIEELNPLPWEFSDRRLDHELKGGDGHPEGIPDELWQQIVHNDALASKFNHWEVDPLMDKVQYILNKDSVNSSTEAENGKHSTKLSLQEAFLAHKQDFISKCKERQKRLVLATEHRKMQEYYRLEREALFLNQERMAPANLFTHPYTDNLYHPKRRLFSKQEMKEMTRKRYKKLPEVLQKQESSKKMELCKINRLRVNIFNKKVQRDLLRKQHLRQR